MDTPKKNQDLIVASQTLGGTCRVSNMGYNGRIHIVPTVVKQFAETYVRTCRFSLENNIERMARVQTVDMHSRSFNGSFCYFCSLSLSQRFDVQDDQEAYLQCQVITCILRPKPQLLGRVHIRIQSGRNRSFMPTNFPIKRLLFPACTSVQGCLPRKLRLQN